MYFFKYNASAFTKLEFFGYIKTEKIRYSSDFLKNLNWFTKNFYWEINWLIMIKLNYLK